VSTRPVSERRSEEYRRRRFVASHRRRGVWVLLIKPFLGAVAMVSLPVGLAAWVLLSPRFHLQEVDIAAGQRVSESWVADRLDPLEGRHLVWLSLPQVEHRLQDHPWLRGVEMHKVLPDKLLVRVVEKQPAALLRHAGSLFYVDQSGAVVESFDWTSEAADLMLLSSADPSPRALATALALAAELERIEPEWAEALSEIEVLKHGDFRLITAVLPFALLVNGRRLESGIRALQKNLPEIHGRFPRVGAVDVRFEKQIVIQPAASPPYREG